jgi:hypothetical protein
MRYEVSSKNVRKQASSSEKESPDSGTRQRHRKCRESALDVQARTRPVRRCCLRRARPGASAGTRRGL